MSELSFPYHDLRQADLCPHHDLAADVRPGPIGHPLRRLLVEPCDVEGYLLGPVAIASETAAQSGCLDPQQSRHPPICTP